MCAGGYSYPRALSYAVGEICGRAAAEEMSKANNILAIDYLRALISCSSGMAVQTMKREEDGYSAHCVREKIRNHEDTEGYVTSGCAELISDVLFISGGDDEGYPERTAPVVEAEQKLGVNVIGYHHPGFHVWDVWRFSAREFMQRIFK